MRKLLLAIAALCILPLQAKEITKEKETVDQPKVTTEFVADNQAAVELQADDNGGSHFLSSLSVALRASTMGGGIQAATPIINNFVTLRAGFDYFSVSPGAWDISLEDTDGLFDQAFGYTPDYSTKGKIQFANGNVLVDLYPTKGIFHITGGVFIGTNTISAKGQLVNPQTGEAAVLKSGNDWPSIDFDGHRLDMTDANLNADLQLGSVIKPYFGFGVGRAISKNNRLSFKFELGAIYQGDYSLKQNGKKLDIIDDATENFEDIDDYKKWLKWWPMLNFQLSYRIF